MGTPEATFAAVESLGPQRAPDAGARRKAALFVAGYAEREDVPLLLEALGLKDYKHPKVRT